MWKIIGCILILFGSGACGFYGVEHMRKRLQELESVKKYTIFMKGEIRYGNRTIPEMLIQMERKAVGNWKKFFGNAGRLLEHKDAGTLSQIWGEMISMHLKTSYLTKEEKKEWKELGDSLGYLDKEMQINLLEIYEEHIKEYIRLEKEKIYSQSKMYQILGIVSGVFLVVIFI